MRKRNVCRSSAFNFIVMSWPPPSAKNSLTMPIFIEEFSSYLESFIISRSGIVMCDDFNFYMDTPTHPDTQKFQELLECTGLTQHVTTTIHSSGHIWDIVLTRASEASHP